MLPRTTKLPVGRPKQNVPWKKVLQLPRKALGSCAERGYAQHPVLQALQWCTVAAIAAAELMLEKAQMLPKIHGRHLQC